MPKRSPTKDAEPPWHLLTARQAGDRLGYTPQHIVRLIESGALSGARTGSVWLVELESVEAFERDRK